MYICLFELVTVADKPPEIGHGMWGEGKHQYVDGTELRDYASKKSK
jgi:hypothetical protein